MVIQKLSNTQRGSRLIRHVEAFDNKVFLISHCEFCQLENVDNILVDVGTI